MSAEDYLRFHEQLAPFLFDEQPVAELEAQLGASASGSDNLDFYRVLIGRNFDKMLRELFAPVHRLVQRLHPGSWPQWTREYARAYPSVARDPNWVGEQFSTWLAQRRERPEGADQSPLLEEMADYVFCRFCASFSADSAESTESTESSDSRAPGPGLPLEPEPDAADDPDGFEQRLFVRLYTFPVVAMLTALQGDPDAPIPSPQPISVLIYRSTVDGFSLCTYRPSMAELAALGRRQGLALPAPLAGLSDALVDAATAKLVSIGALTA